MYENQLISGKIFHVITAGSFANCVLEVDILNEIIIQNYDHHHIFNISRDSKELKNCCRHCLKDFPAMQSSSDMKETELRPYNKVLRHYKTFSGETLGLSLRKIERTLAVSFPRIRKATGNHRRRCGIRSRVLLTRFQIIM